MQLPDAASPTLHLAHPTPSEKTATWTLNSRNWGTTLTLSSYLDRESYMTTVPLSANGGITHWILVDSSSTPDSRPILSSVETIRKRVLVAKDGVVKEVITHGIGSVFCNPEYRGKGYASRMLSELGPTLNTWQVDETIQGREECLFSILYSDIGKKYYAKHGWLPFPSTHIHFPPAPTATTNGTAIHGTTNGIINGTSNGTTNGVANGMTNGTTNGITSGTGYEIATKLKIEDVEDLCIIDEQYVRNEMSQARDGKTHVTLVPDYETMQWHHLREDFMTSQLFSKTPTTRGAIAGRPGNRVWAIWARSFYGPVDEAGSGNTLHILRLVVEDAEDTKGNIQKLRAIVKIAQKEAKDWKCVGVEIWNPTPSVKKLVENLGLEHSEVERQEESIPSLMWYGKENGEDIVWVGNEKFGWC